MESDTWHMLDGLYEVMCQMESKSNKSLSGTHVGHVSLLERMKSKVLNKWIREIQIGPMRGRHVARRGHPI